MTEKCCLCGEEMKTSFLEKPDGTVIKVKKDDKNKNVFVCSSCQKKFKGDLKKEIENKFK